MAKPTLLVADSDPRSLRILEVALRKAHFDVATASDGVAALKLLKAQPTDLVLCDIALEGVDGYAICRAARTDNILQGVPFLLMSADKSRSVKAKAMDAGADDFLGKPLLLKELVTRVQLLLERRDAQAVAQKDSPAALTGEVGDLGLVDLFQSLDQWRKSGVVICESADGRNARVWVRDGQVIDADVWPLSGEPAFWRLLTWEKGTFRVDFAPVDREAHIQTGTQGLLLEAMRRVDEIARLSERLPPDTKLVVDFAELALKLADLPDEVNGVLRAFDGRRTLHEAVELSPVDDLSTYAMVQRLLTLEVLRRRSEVIETPRPFVLGRPSLQQWLANEAPIKAAPPPPPDEALEHAMFHASDDSPMIADEVASQLAESMAHAEQHAARAQAAAEDEAALAVADRTLEFPALAKPLDLVRFPPLRGVRRERLRREAEAARKKVAAGAPVRLSHVVDLPPWDGNDALDGLRRMSPAVGEAAKKFAPDPIVSRVNHREGPVAPVTDPGPPVFAKEEALLSTPLITPPPPPLVQSIETPPPPIAKALEEVLAPPEPRRGPWRAVAAVGLIGAALAGWLLWPRQHTDKRDAPWLEPAKPVAQVAPPPPAPVVAEKPEVATAAVAPQPPPPQPAQSAPSAPASDEYQQALEKGDAYVKRGAYRRAIGEFRKAVKVNPDSVPALLALGDAYLESDQPKSAVKPLETAAQLDARSARAQLLLGTAYQSLGKNPEATKAYERYLELEPKGEFANDVKSILANLAR